MPTVRLAHACGRYGDAATSRIKRCWSAADGHHFHAHPELVNSLGDKRYGVVLCSVCERAVLQRGCRPPPLSIASGADFGMLERLGMELP